MTLGTTTALLAALSALAVGPVPALAPVPAGARTWTADLQDGEASGVAVDGGVARLDRATAFLAAAEGAAEGIEALTTAGAAAALAGAEGAAALAAGSTAPPSAGDVAAAGGAAAAPVPTGLLTLAPRDLAAPTDRIAASVDADLPAGTSATVDVRARRARGGWTEWVPARAGTAVLPEPASQVQGRLVLTGSATATPVVREVALTAGRGTRTGAAPAPAGGTEQAPLAYRVFATREGLVGGTTANGHVITERDHFVALPSRRALAPRGTSDYAVEVCAPNGRCAFAPVWDVGPWNTRDDYWNAPRQQWRDLPQGVPQAQAARLDGHNGGRDQFGRRVANPAGIDLADGLFWDALGLTDNSWVTVEYLWTGRARLATVVTAEPVRRAPDAAAEVVGLAAERAAVPVECAAGGWLRVGADQYLPAGAVAAVDVVTCAGGAATAG